MGLEIIDILYITLIIFISITWTLLTIILLKLIKVVSIASEIVNSYNKIKRILLAYKNIPNMLKEKIFDFIWKKK